MWLNVDIITGSNLAMHTETTKQPAAGPDSGDAEAERGDDRKEDTLGEKSEWEQEG